MPEPAPVMMATFKSDIFLPFVHRPVLGIVKINSIGPEKLGQSLKHQVY
jgi:hypothetical protein